MKKINFFVVSSPWHYYIANYMVMTLDEFSESENVLYIVRTDINVIDKADNWLSIIYANKDLYSSNLLFAKSLVKKELATLETLFCDYDSVIMFLPTLYKWNNILYNHFLKDDKKYHYFNFPDGNDSFYFKKVNRKTLYGRWLKCLISKFCGIEYFWHDCFRYDYVGISLAERVYSYIPENLKYHIDCEIKRIPLVKNRKEINVNNDRICIFLGQVIEFGMKNDTKHKITECFKYIQAREENIKIFYKPHPREKVELVKEYLDKYGFEIMRDKEAIESVIRNVSVKTIYSFYSSALINLKIMFGENIECVAYKGLEFYEVQEENANVLKDIYRNLGIEYIS